MERDGVERDGVEQDGVEQDGVEQDGGAVAFVAPWTRIRLLRLGISAVMAVIPLAIAIWYIANSQRVGEISPIICTVKTDGNCQSFPSNTC